MPPHESRDRPLAKGEPGAAVNAPGGGIDLECADCLVTNIGDIEQIRRIIGDNPVYSGTRGDATNTPGQIRRALNFSKSTGWTD